MRLRPPIRIPAMQVSLRSSFGGKPEKISVPPPKKPGRPRKSVASPAASAPGDSHEPLDQVIGDVSDCVPGAIPTEAMQGCPQLPRRQFTLAFRLGVVQFIEGQLQEGLVLENIFNAVSQRLGIPLRSVQKWWFSGKDAVKVSLAQRGLTPSGQWTKSESQLPKSLRKTRISGGIRAKGGGPRTHSASSTQSSINGF